MPLVIPVNLVMKSGMGRKGLMSVENSSSTRLLLNLTAPISMIASVLGSSPVVSRSRATIDGMGGLYHYKNKCSDIEDFLVYLYNCFL